MYNLFIFRRDLRLKDNKGLYNAIKNFKNIIPIFIFTPEQITDKNKYRSDNAIQFMVESLKELDKNLKKKNSKLHIFNGDNIEILSKICEIINIENIIFNMDYTPYAIARDKSIEDFCNKKNINCIQIEDYLLSKVGELNKSDGSPYTIFTPFKNNGLKKIVDKPSKYKIINLIKVNNLPTSNFIKYSKNANIIYHGGRSNGLKKLKNLKNLGNYNDDRNTLSINTSHLSAYIKFGCVSIREVYWFIKKLYKTDNNLLSQLYWREFYFYIAYYFPYVMKGENYNKKYDNLKWTNDKKLFSKWCNGETGYPVVDAGMKELNTTGYMHNRARLITANFVNRLFGIDWRWGEKYYAKQLVDYDPIVNNGNWQWIASTGVDPKPYFQRLFNPWLQSKKFDTDAKYIKKWLPNLKDIPAKELHQWDKNYLKYDLKNIEYYAPAVNYKIARKKSIEMYRKVL